MFRNIPGADVGRLSYLYKHIMGRTRRRQRRPRLKKGGAKDSVFSMGSLLRLLDRHPSQKTKGAIVDYGSGSESPRIIKASSLRRKHTKRRKQKRRKKTSAKKTASMKKDQTRRVRKSSDGYHGDSSSASDSESASDSNRSSSSNKESRVSRRANIRRPPLTQKQRRRIQDILNQRHHAPSTKRTIFHHSSATPPPVHMDNLRGLLSPSLDL